MPFHCRCQLFCCRLACLLFSCFCNNVILTLGQYSYLLCSACFWIHTVLLKLARRVYHLKFDTFFPQTFRHSVSNPKPNKSFFRYSSTINGSAFGSTVILSSSFGSKTCTTLKIQFSVISYIDYRSIACHIHKYYLQHERPCCIGRYQLEPKARVCMSDTTRMRML